MTINVSGREYDFINSSQYMEEFSEHINKDEDPIEILIAGMEQEELKGFTEFSIKYFIRGQPIFICFSVVMDVEGLYILNYDGVETFEY